MVKSTVIIIVGSSIFSFWGSSIYAATWTQKGFTDFSKGTLEKAKIVYYEQEIPPQFIGGGTAMGWRADEAKYRYTLPFNFNFYGKDYDTIFIDTNGVVEFLETGADYWNTLWKLHSRPMIAPLWDDLMTNVNTTDDIYIHQPTENSLCIRWQGTTFNKDPSLRLPINVEVILYKNGKIQFNYGAGNTNLTPTIGVSNGMGSYTVSRYNDKTALTNVNSVIFISSLSQNRTSQIVYSCNFEDETARTSWTMTGLWHYVHDDTSPYPPPPPHLHSCKYSLWYGSDITGNYDVGTNRGTITSPVINLAGLNNAHLYWRNWSKTEFLQGLIYDLSYDRQLGVVISGNSPHLRWYHTSSFYEDIKPWQVRYINLTEFIPNTIQLRYIFDTVNAENNNYRGWYIDDVEIVEVGDYYSQATFTSATFYIATALNLERISWSQILSPNTTIRLQIATNNDNSTWNFLGPGGLPNTYYTNPAGEEIWSGHDGDTYLRFRVIFISTDNTQTPYLQEVNITYTDDVAPSDVDIIEARDMKLGDTVRVVWNLNQETDVLGYKIYYSQNFFLNCNEAIYYPQSPSSNPKATYCDVVGLTPKTKYYFAVTAIDNAGNEDKIVTPSEVFSCIPTYGQILVVLVTDAIYGGPPDDNTIATHLNNLGYFGKYGIWDKARRGSAPTLEILNNYKAVLWFAGSTWRRSITQIEARMLYQYVENKGNVALFGEDYGYDAAVDGWASMNHPSTWTNIFRVLNDATDNNNNEWEDEVDVANTQVILSLNHPITKYIGSGTTFEVTGYWLDGYKNIAEGIYTKRVLEYTQGAKVAAGINIAAVAYDGKASSPVHGRIFYFAGVFKDVSGFCIKDPSIRENLLRGVLEWLFEPTTPLTSIEIIPATATVIAQETQTLTASGYDEYGNEIPSLVYNWSVLGNIGTVSPDTGKTVIFTATSTNTFTSGSIVATSGTVKGTATISVQPKMLSILVTPNNVDWGTLTVDSLSSVATITITNTGSIKENFYFSLGTFTTGTYSWNLGTTTGLNRCIFEYSTDTTTYQKVLTYNTPILFLSSVPANTSKNIYLRLTTPKVISSSGRYNAYLIFTAEAAP